MPLQLPNLDDRTYEDLVAEALSLIPTYTPKWTNHNPSDPGITLIELFAYLTEMLLYRLNRVTDANKYAFLQLLNGPNWKPSSEKTLNEEIRDTVLALRQSDRAITCEDFETLALAADPRVARAHCVPRRHLEAGSAEDRPGNVSVIIVPATVTSSDEKLTQIVKDYLQPRRLLTTQVHVVEPRYLTIGIQITLVLKSDAKEETVRNDAIKALQKFFDPLKGGTDGKGWPFGRDVYVSEIYELLDKQPGVDYVRKTQTTLDEIKVNPQEGRRRKSIIKDEKIGEQLIAIEIQPDELVNLEINPDEIITESPVQPYSYINNI